jgi:hypothetical protein
MVVVRECVKPLDLAIVQGRENGKPILKRRRPGNEKNVGIIDSLPNQIMSKQPF